MDDNCGEWVECMGVASGCGEQEVGVASGSGWNLWLWLLGVVLKRYIDFLIYIYIMSKISDDLCIAFGRKTTQLQWIPGTIKSL